MSTFVSLTYRMLLAAVCVVSCFFNLALFSSAIASAVPASNTQAAVTIQLNEAEFTYTAAPRLNEVLAPVALDRQWYWPAAQLFRLSAGASSVAPTAEQTQQQILAKLTALIADAEPELQQALYALAYEIKQWQVAERIILPIDYDLARINPAFNPRFEPGNYVLRLTERPDQVRIFGAVNSSRNTPHIGALTVEAYLAAVSLNAYADTGKVWVIQPDGHVKAALVHAAANNLVQPMPGAMLFIPFSASWFNKDLAELNTLVLSLAVNRVL
ncbi:capsule biosynthesis GfcC family protein [Alishewanella sp. d11]|uniref:capsule biosynthesis GfcC family protein n=1 Tax=Alishewanella sp. d11 TaxID=3414030 RepID=UPI003BF8B8FB